MHTSVASWDFFCCTVASAGDIFQSSRFFQLIYLCLAQLVSCISSALQQHFFQEEGLWFLYVFSMVSSRFATNHFPVVFLRSGFPQNLISDLQLRRVIFDVRSSTNSASKASFQFSEVHSGTRVSISHRFHKLLIDLIDTLVRQTIYNFITACCNS